MSEFLDVITILSKHGDKIMRKFASKQDQSSMGEYYDCVFGNAFLTDLFTENRITKSELYYFNTCQQLQSYTSRSRIKPGFIYHFQLETELTAEELDIFYSQVHFFTIICDQDATILLQTLGGAKGILIKTVHEDINELLKRIMNEDSEIFTRLFEVPTDLEDLAYYKFETMAYLKVPLYYPTLTDLDSILTELGLDYASEKIAYRI